MSYSPLAIKRKSILGNIYDQCEAVDRIPVYLNEKSDEPLGFMDESLGHYTDAFLFHLPEDVCKKLSTGHFDYAFDYDYTDELSNVNRKKKIKLNYILLVPKRSLRSADR